MRMRDPGKPLDPRIAADLATVDRALSGLPVEGGDADLAELALLLRDERPASEPRWAAELDERAAAGFPRGGGGPVRRARRGDAGAASRGSAEAAGWSRRERVATLAVVVVVATSSFDGGSGEPTMSDQAATGDPRRARTHRVRRRSAASKVEPAQLSPSIAADSSAAGDQRPTRRIPLAEAGGCQDRARAPRTGRSNATRSSASRPSPRTSAASPTR